MTETISSVYLDVCVLNRPFDDQRQMRIQLETAAVHLILANVRSSMLRLVVSPVHILELNAISDTARRTSLQSLIREFGTHSRVDTEITQRRAVHLHGLGMGVADAAHIAYSEAMKTDFVTVDDRLLRQCARIGIQIWIGTPIAFCEKEGLE